MMDTINFTVGEDSQSNEDHIDVVCILDRSGSMQNIASEVIGAFNNFLTEQKNQPGEARLTLVLFDDQYEIVHDKVDIQDVPELTREVYFTRGMTALNDAVGKTLGMFSNSKAALFLIQTDGMENASREYRPDVVGNMIKERKAAGCEFVFIGSDISEGAAAMNIGINVNNAINIDKNANWGDMYGSVAATTTTAFRSAKVADINAVYDASEDLKNLKGE